MWGVDVVISWSIMCGCGVLMSLSVGPLCVGVDVVIFWSIMYGCVGVDVVWVLMCVWADVYMALLSMSSLDYISAILRELIQAMLKYLTILFSISTSF